jgi:phosphopantothenoylcysteine decarboxylase/phosphopantothenate--cysteine ligase
VSALHNNLLNKHILLGVSGSIAAYKAAVLLRLLQEQGAEVRVIMTRGATEFVTPMTFQALSGHPVHTELLDEQAEAAMGHIQLARWADAIVIAPASADCIARLAQGRADDLLAAVCLASPAPQIVAPAMNQQMWLNPATQDNVNTLKARRNISVIGPGSGDQACGDVGPGRMLEPEQIVTEIKKCFVSETLLGKTVLITAGPTQEPIDPVRYLSNRSSGKMGFALAQAALEAGAKVILISGPVSLATPAINSEKQADRIDVRTAQQMHDTVMQYAAQADIVIACAAVSDYRPSNVAEQKIKKSSDTLTLQLTRNPDILADIAQQFPQLFTIGFAAETEDLRHNAQAKLQNKGLNLIVANRVDDDTIGFESDDNAVTVYWAGGQQEFAKARKNTLARDLLALVIKQLTSQDH